MDLSSTLTLDITSLVCFNKQHLAELGIKHIVGRVHHPETNGKVERFYGTFQQKIHLFNDIDEFMHWYNYIKPHQSLDFDRPVNAFYDRLDRRRKYPPMLNQSEASL